MGLQVRFGVLAACRHEELGHGDRTGARGAPTLFEGSTTIVVESGNGSSGLCRGLVVVCGFSRLKAKYTKYDGPDIYQNTA